MPRRRCFDMKPSKEKIKPVDKISKDELEAMWELSKIRELIFKLAKEVHNSKHLRDRDWDMIFNYFEEISRYGVAKIVRALKTYKEVR